jgi:predicted nuclease of restriction endonuclease-like RecB superfamily
MLTREHAIYALDGDRVVPDRLMTKTHAHYVGIAEAMLTIYRGGIGKPRSALHAAVRRLFDNDPDCRPQRIEAFCKLLDDPPGTKFNTDSRGKAAALRCKVFRLGSEFHPLVKHKEGLFENVEGPVKTQIALQVGYASWEELEQDLFTDVFEYNRLLSFTGFDSPQSLLARYNVAQVQVALSNATRLTVCARADFKRIITQAKLARLLHTITAPPPENPHAEYVIELAGPASVLVETRRYGMDMAKFLPSLLACRDWSMYAEIRMPRHRRPLRLELSPRDSLHSNVLPPEEFDSAFEERFDAKWGDEKREGWLHKREGDILDRAQTVTIPDFSFYHDDGRRAFLEIAAYWTPEYIRDKSEKLKLFADAPIILALPEAAAKKWPTMPQNVLLYKTALNINAVLEALNRVAPPHPSGSLGK